MKKVILIILIFISSNCFGQRLRSNTVFDITIDDFEVDISDTIPLLFRITEKDTIINDTIGTIKYLLQENERLYDKIYEQNKRLIEICLTINSLLMYIPKKNQYFEL